MGTIRRKALGAGLQSHQAWFGIIGSNKDRRGPIHNAISLDYSIQGRHSKSKDSPHPHGEIDCFENGCSIHDNPEIGRARAALDDDTIQVFGDILDRPIEWDMICNEINNDRPIIIRTKNADASYHLLAIIGYDSDVPSIALWDPAMGIRIESYNALQRRVGVWTHTVLTQPPGAGAFNIQ